MDRRVELPLTTALKALVIGLTALGSLGALLLRARLEPVLAVATYVMARRRSGAGVASVADTPGLPA